MPEWTFLPPSHPRAMTQNRWRLPCRSQLYLNESLPGILSMNVTGLFPNVSPPPTTIVFNHGHSKLRSSQSVSGSTVLVLVDENRKSVLRLAVSEQNNEPKHITPPPRCFLSQSWAPSRRVFGHTVSTPAVDDVSRQCTSDSITLDVYATAMKPDQYRTSYMG